MKFHLGVALGCALLISGCAARMKAPEINPPGKTPTCVDRRFGDACPNFENFWCVCTGVV